MGDLLILQFHGELIITLFFLMISVKKCFVCKHVQWLTYQCLMNAQFVSITRHVSNVIVEY